MNALESLEKEVAERTAQMTTEMVLLLIERWEEKLQRDFEEGKLSADKLLGAYVNMKITLHRIARNYNRDNYYTCDLETQHRAESLMSGLREKIKEARKKYYVAKHRYYEPDQHGDGCSCRGCRCIKGISAGSQGPSGQDPFGKGDQQAS